MTQSFTTQSLQMVLGYPFRDPEWKNKLLIASALVLAGSFVPLVPLVFVYGYYAEIMRRVITGEEPHLPAWDDWGQLAIDGLKWWGVSLVYSLPAIAAALVGMGVYVGFSLIPFWMSTEPSATEALVAPMAAMALGAAAVGLSGILSLAAGLLTPPAFGHVLATGEFGAAFRVRAWWPIVRANLGGFLLSYLVVMGIGMVLSLVVQVFYFTVVLCCLAPVVVAPITVYTLLMRAALFGEAYRIGRDNIPAAPGATVIEEEV
ncbi:MAG: DUF4013 domain-containing protein [Anaerolineae bacterium]|nr:DUF4013 domain-containing protein [Anaerolineae bacterium]